MVFSHKKQHPRVIITKVSHLKSVFYNVGFRLKLNWPQNYEVGVLVFASRMQTQCIGQLIR
jgi:hypothetical protein